MEVGMEKVVDVTSARRQFGTILDEVFHKGDIFTIARKGKALAKIVPLEQPKNVESISSQQNNYALPIFKLLKRTLKTWCRTISCMRMTTEN
jgi:antitoxin (DNA-binding transcriptional repressor) of toxin-antitoxin stability system